MSKDVKVLLIVFGSLVGLVLIAAVAAIAFVTLSISHQVANSNSKNTAAAAAKIATLTLPPGYRYDMAMDMAFMNMVVITGPARRRNFMIELQGMALPTAGSSRDQLEQSMRQGLGIGSKCDAQSDGADEQLKTASGKTVTLHTLRCSGNGTPERLVEFGLIPSHYPVAIISAIGTTQAFDHAALSAIVGSIK